ncbi:TPA: hypothetical protein P0E24_005102 [Vibrio campbellii]|nr:hypothetical protein [Vibrio campbellii]HDM8225512.1 hypothetical protein [Vibrio campbellii]HDM8243029.1 hypothetical protein [Vibrio campbellii]HDM8245894.1 hypothetical protein [Vibrio campbellii]
MPIKFCSDCNKSTQHKQVMKRNNTQQQNISGKTARLMVLVSRCFTGNHYHELTPQFYCRTCNQHFQGTAEIKDLHAQDNLSV